jgi:hypothetical protein
VRVRDLLDVPGLGLRLLTDVTGLDRAITHVYTTDLPDPGRYLTQGDLVLTGMMWCREPGDADRFVRALVKSGANVLGAGEALGEVPPEIIEACGRHGVALLAVPSETSFGSVIDEVGRRISGDRASAMTRVLGRRRLLLSAVAEGAGLDEMFRLMGREIGAECWLLTATGRVICGTGPALSRPQALRLAAEYVKADRLPAVVRDDRARYSVFGVGGDPRLTGWFLACPGREQDWPHELRESVAELVADVALERARLDAGRTGDRKLGEAIIGQLAADAASSAEVVSLMRAADLAPDGCYLLASVRADGEGRSGGDAERWRCDLTRELAEPSAQRVLLAPLGADVIALVPVAATGGVTGAVTGGGTAGVAGNGRSAAHVFADRLREAQPVFEADRARLRVSVGVSAPACGVAALAGALHEAGSAGRLAALRSGGMPGISVVTSDEVASHELLLASVPASVQRAFRERLLGPLMAYDDQHHAELLPTLREFLDCSGSWNACAARMYVHVNTVRYRIRRVEELTGRDLSSLDDRVDFFLALRIR